MGRSLRHQVMFGSGNHALNGVAAQALETLGFQRQLCRTDQELKHQSSLWAEWTDSGGKNEKMVVYNSITLLTEKYNQMIPDYKAN